jgi:hypothetical protein
MLKSSGKKQREIKYVHFVTTASFRGYKRKSIPILCFYVTFSVLLLVFSHSRFTMGSRHTPLPPLWRLEELFSLSDQYPSGLVHNTARGKRRRGDQAGRLNRSNSFYLVSVDNQRYLAHRIVYLMRHKTPIEGYDIVHRDTNKTKDNRMELIAVPVSNRFS